MSFISKSRDVKKATTFINNDTKEIVEVYSSKNILWFGENEVLQKFGTQLGFKILPLLHCCADQQLLSSFVVFNNVFNDKYLRVLNFCVNYSIPCIWIHDFIVPTKWMWSFDVVLVGETSIANVWSQICKIV